MFQTLDCIRDHHDPAFVILAALICGLANITAMLLLRHARNGAGRAGLQWAAAGGLAAGFGIWATHFIAMLGFMPGFAVGYELRLTLISLVVPIVTTIAGFLAVLHSQRRVFVVACSLAIGLGFAMMHYTGMAALDLPARVEWNATYVAASILFALLPIYPALHLSLRGRKFGSVVGAGLLLALGVVLLHFTSMAGMRLRPSGNAPGGMILSPDTVAACVGLIALALVGLCVVAMSVSRSAGRALRNSERELGLLITSISDCAICRLDLSGRITHWNIGAAHLFGHTAQQATGLAFTELVQTALLSARGPELLTVAAQAGRHDCDGWGLRLNGSRFRAHLGIERLLDETGRHVGFAAITRDVTRAWEDQQRIDETTIQLDTALNHMHQGLCLFDAEGRLVRANQRMAELCRLAPGALVPGMALVEIGIAISSALGGVVDLDRVETLCAALRPPASSGESLRHAASVVREFDDQLVISITSRPLPSGGWVTTLEDITERRRSEVQIAHMALHDGLTGLPNRIQCASWLDQALVAHRGRQIGVVAIDLNDFKGINDGYGHAAGDDVLRNLGERLRAVMQPDEMIARVGGDEFCAQRYFETDTELAEFVQRLRDCFAHPTVSHGRVFSLGASFGIATFPRDGNSREALANNADLAMYRAKKGGGAERICYYAAEMDETARQRRQLAADLGLAVARNELHLLYQPQYDFSNDRFSGQEALLRWQHPRLGLVSPMEFIPLAEETGAIVEIGAWVLREACTEAAGWSSPQRVAVNLSAVQLMLAELPEQLDTILRETGLPPERLELEVTETAIISDRARAFANLNRIKALGIGVAMDDFGTGYSSLDTLRAFPFDKIKIDKSFLLEEGESPQSRAIIRAVLALGASLGIPVIAEGVETKAHVRFLAAEGCTEAQGYYFGRPVRAAAIQFSPPQTVTQPAAPVVPPACPSVRTTETNPDHASDLLASLG